MLEHTAAGSIPWDSLPLTGALAVKSFFVISGFYIQMVVAEKYSALPHWIPVFYKSRLLRIYPPYVVALLFSLMLYFVFGTYIIGYADHYSRLWHLQNWPTLLYGIWTNLGVIGSELGGWVFYDAHTGNMHCIAGAGAGQYAYAPLNELMLVSQGWSLSLEIMFYLLAPWLLRLRSKTLVCFAVVSFLLNAVVIFFHYYDVQRYTLGYSLPTDLHFFLLGVLSYRFWTARPRQIEHPKRMLAAMIGFHLLYAVLYRHVPVFDPIREYTYIGLLTATLPLLYAVTRHNRLDRRLGELSYPLYLLHNAMRTVAVSLALPQPAWWTWGLSFIGAWLMARFIERPLDAIRKPPLAAPD